MQRIHQLTQPRDQNRSGCWDTTWLPGAIRGQFYYLYIIIDLFSRKVIARVIWFGESPDHGSANRQTGFWIR